MTDHKHSDSCCRWQGQGRRIVLEESDRGKITYTPLDPDEILHEVHGKDKVFRYKVQDILDQISRAR